MIDYQLSQPSARDWHPNSWVLRTHGPAPQVLRGAKTWLTRWLRERRGALPFYMHLIVRADFGSFDGSDYVLLLDRPEDHTAVLAAPDGAPVEIDLRPRLDPDDVVHRTRPASGGRRALTVHSVQRRDIGSTTWTEAHCYDPAEDRSDLIVFRSSDRLRTWTPAARTWAEYEEYQRTGELVEELRRSLGIDRAAENFVRNAVLLLLRRPYVPIDFTHGHVDA
ncbi:MAG TPA: hypothetical protein VGS97_23340 [Actinocrinis sp.]|uniref:hypothetical protein n=1 Tax=Actinocrinis sp. TaxID=1920516 RepID=UPI002DDCC9D2|nr:hypothetical protein [Actinocrinis sp.]HEV2347056.1 hypothetical protein [Actinocrinis sp.]